MSYDVAFYYCVVFYLLYYLLIEQFGTYFGTGHDEDTSLLGRCRLSLVSTFSALPSAAGPRKGKGKVLGFLGSSLVFGQKRSTWVHNAPHIECYVDLLRVSASLVVFRRSGGQAVRSRVFESKVEKPQGRTLRGEWAVGEFARSSS